MPQIIVLDIGLPDASGFDIISELQSDNAEAKVIIFSMYETLSFVSTAFEKGAKGYITKNDDPNTILTAVDKVRDGSIYLGQAVAQNLALVNLSVTHDPLRNLSERERQIVLRLGRGKSLTEIAIELVLGYKDRRKCNGNNQTKTEDYNDCRTGQIRSRSPIKAMITST